MSTLASRNAPSRSAATFSSIGPSVLQGPHHSAHRSTTTGRSREPSITVRSKVSSVTSMTCSMVVLMLEEILPSLAGRPAPPIIPRNASTRCGCSRYPARGRSCPRCRLAAGCEEARRVRAGDRDGPRVPGARRRRSAGHAPHHADGSADRRSRAPTEPDGTCSLRRPRLGSRGLPDRDGLALVAGMTPEQIFLGVFSKATDPTSGGRQMPSHWSSKELGIVSHSSPIATQVPHAAGIAYAMKYRNEDAVVASWFGEGATSEGDWHEGLNIAAIHRLPVVFICENNEYAISVPQSKQMAVADVATRAAGYGIPGFVVDGNDVLACFRVMKDAHDRARAGEGPTLIECKTYRFLPHTSDDDDKSYRSREEVEERRSHDPIERFATYLVEAGIADRDALQAVHDEVRAQVEAAITAAWDA